MRKRIRRSHTVEHERSEVYVRIGGIVVEFHRIVVFRKVALIEVIRSAARNGIACFACVDGSRRRCVYYVKLVIRFLFGVFAVYVLGNGHRVVHVGIGKIVRIIEIIACPFYEHIVRTRRRVIGIEVAVLFVHAVNGVVFACLYKAVACRIVGKTEIIILHRRRSVEFRTLEIDIAVFNRTALYALVCGRRSIINVIAVDIDTRRIIFCYEQHGNNRFRLGIFPCVEVCAGNTHQSAFHYAAVLVLRRVTFHAVDKIDVTALFNNETTVVYCRYVGRFVIEFLPLILVFTGYKRKRRSQESCCSYYAANLFYCIPHK